MIRSEWNELRVGEHVRVHEETDAGWVLVPGRVTTVVSAPGSNDVAIRLPSKRGPSRIVHPRRLLVHPEELGADSRCWRCRPEASDAG